MSPPDRRWLALAVLCGAFFMVILDVAIVGVAAPSIQADLDFSQQGLQWVVSAYAIAFGGLLLLGGRAADLLGRRRTFVAGTALFALASLACGLAWSPAALVAARAAQGVGAALLSPAALAIITTIFAAGPERNKALGIWNAIGAVGGTTGLLLGGVLTDTVGWEWLFFLNVPVGVVVIVATRALIAESRTSARRRFDLPGAVAITSGLVALVYGLVDAPDAGWRSAQSLLLFLVAAALIVIFLVVEARTSDPLMPLAVAGRRSVAGANLLALVTGAALFSWFFIATLYLQQVLGFSPLEAGAAFLAGALGGLAGSGLGQALATRLGPRLVALIGTALVSVGLLLQARISVGGDYLTDLLPPFVLMGLGTGFAFVAAAIIALAVEERHAGLASGLFNTAQQIGGAIGVAVLSTVAVSTTDDRLAGGADIGHALTEGFADAFLVALLFPTLAAAILFVARPPSATAAEPAPAAAESS